MQELLETFVGANGWMVQVLSIIGLLRVLIKPITEAAIAYAKWTDNKRDDSLVDKVIKSSIYQKLLFVLDWLTSIKIKK